MRRRAAEAEPPVPPPKKGHPLGRRVLHSTGPFRGQGTEEESLSRALSPEAPSFVHLGLLFVQETGFLPPTGGVRPEIDVSGEQTPAPGRQTGTRRPCLVLRASCLARRRAGPRTWEGTSRGPRARRTNRRAGRTNGEGTFPFVPLTSGGTFLTREVRDAPENILEGLPGQGRATGEGRLRWGTGWGTEGSFPPSYPPNPSRPRTLPIVPHSLARFLHV